MKEIYKIPKGQNVATSEGWKHIDTEIKNFVYETEQVPETFEEFQEICEKVIDKSKHSFEAHKGFTVIDEYQFRDDGSVWLYYENVDIVRNITIFQMWLILKGIFGV